LDYQATGHGESVEQNRGITGLKIKAHWMLTEKAPEQLECGRQWPIGMKHADGDRVEDESIYTVLQR